MLSFRAPVGLQQSCHLRTCPRLVQLPAVKASFLRRGAAAQVISKPPRSAAEGTTDELEKTKTSAVAEAATEEKVEATKAEAPSNHVEDDREFEEAEGEPGTAVYDLIDGQDVDVQKVASDVAKLAGNSLVVRCPNARTIAPTLQALAMAGSEVKGGRLQVLPRVRYEKIVRDARSGNKRRVTLAEGLERGFRATFVVKVVPLPGGAAAQDFLTSSPVRVSGSGEPGRIASAICACMRSEAQQCGVQALGYRAILAAFKAMVIARMRLLFPGSPQNGSQAAPQPLNFAIYPSVSQEQADGESPVPAFVARFHILPHELPYKNEAERAEYESKSRQLLHADLGRVSSAISDPARQRQARSSVPTIQVPVEEWAAMKKSVELLTQQNADLLSLVTKALKG